MMQHAGPQSPLPRAEMSLREQLLAAGNAGAGPSPYPPTGANAPLPAENSYQSPNPASPHEHRFEHPPGHLYDMGADDVGDDGTSPDSRKGKRELSTSKRAAQNRAAQRAFRQRKEGYIKKLEEQVKEFQSVEQNFRMLQTENYQLREYVLNLQGRLLESHADFPPAPTQVTLPTHMPSARTGAGDSASSLEQQRPQEGSTEPIRHDGMSQLQAAAAQANEAARVRELTPYGVGGRKGAFHEQVASEAGHHKSPVS